MKETDTKIMEKVDCEHFDEQLNYLKSLMQAAQADGITIEIPQPPPSSGLSTKEMAQFKEMIQKLSEFESRFEEQTT